MEEDFAVVEHKINEGNFGSVDSFPQIYVAAWTIVGHQRFPGPYDSVCRSVLPVTEASFRLEVMNESFGRFSVTLDTFDRLGNYPGHNVSMLSGEVPIRWGVNVRIREAGSQAWVDYAGCGLDEDNLLEVGFSAPWKARRADALCFAGANSFRRRINITRVGIIADDDSSSLS